MPAAGAVLAHVPPIAVYLLHCGTYAKVAATNVPLIGVPKTNYPLKRGKLPPSV